MKARLFTNKSQMQHPAMARVFAFALGLCMLLTLLLTAVEQTIFDESLFEAAYEQAGTAASIGIAEDDLMEVTRHMLAYLHGDELSLQQEMVIGGTLREVYTEREILHMVDVEVLFHIGFVLRLVCILGIAAFLGLLLAVHGATVRHIAGGYLSAMGVLLVLMGLLAMAVNRDFDAAFTQFHLLLFNNDYWLLDGSTMLIRMFPASFFNEVTWKLIIQGTVWVLIPAGVALIALIVAGVLYFVRGRSA